MLQIFVPVGSALGLALLGYRFALRSDLRAKGTEARLAIQRQALEERCTARAHDVLGQCRQAAAICLAGAA